MLQRKPVLGSSSLVHATFSSTLEPGKLGDRDRALGIRVGAPISSLFSSLWGCMPTLRSKANATAAKG